MNTKMLAAVAADACSAVLAGCGGSSTHQKPDTVACRQVAATGSLSPDAAGEALTKISNEPSLDASLADQIEAWAQPDSTLDDWHALVAMCQHYTVRNDVGSPRSVDTSPLKEDGDGRAICETFSERQCSDGLIAAE
jgi:hypothetical protein